LFLVKNVGPNIRKVQKNLKPMPQTEKDMFKEAASLGILEDQSIIETNPRAKLISHMQRSKKALRSPFGVTL
jgi:hypothetical protein